MRTSIIIVIALVVFVPAQARGDAASAGRAFADGQAAQLEGDYDHAAQSFELAYSIAPSKEALRSAVRARKLADQLARAAMLAEVLAAQYADDITSTKLAGEILAEAKSKLARVTVTCDVKCTLAIGGRAVSLAAATTHVMYAPAGRHTLELGFDDNVGTTRDVIAVVGEDREVRVDRPSKKLDAAPVPVVTAAPPVVVPTSRPVAESRGLSPAVVIVGGVVTLGLAGATLWSGLDVRKAKDAYVANPTHAGFEDGRSKQLRTNLLLGGSVVAGVATAAIAVWWTRWHGPSDHAVTIAPSTTGATISLGGSF